MSSSSFDSKIFHTPFKQDYINTMRDFPKLRLIADAICKHRTRNGEHCMSCPAYDTDYCNNYQYWLKKSAKSTSKVRNTEKEIKKDMIDFFGEELFNEMEKYVEENYDSNFKFIK